MIKTTSASCGEAQAQLTFRMTEWLTQGKREEGPLTKELPNKFLDGGVSVKEWAGVELHGLGGAHRHLHD